MSGVIEAPRRQSGPAANRTPRRATWPGPSVDGVAGLGLAAALALLAFVTSGGIELASNTWSQIALIVLGAVVAIAVVLTGARGPAWGGVTLAVLAVLAGLTFASIAWSVQPATSWLEANRTLSYLAAFGSALALARLTPERWPALVGAVPAAAVVVCGYALLVKVFPATFDPTDVIGRLNAPFDYWNATGLMAALGLPGCLWAGARLKPGAVVSRALSVPAVAVLLAVLVLSYSRGALLAAGVGLACWFALAPLRLRGALVLVLGGAGGALLSAWALAHHALTHNGVPLPSRVSAGHTFGVVVLLVVALLTIAGYLMSLAADRVSMPAWRRRQIGAALLIAVALIPIGGVVALAVSRRGLTGEVSHVWSELTSSGGGVGNSPSRLVELSNSRPRYWHDGLTVGEHALFKGVGARGYATAYTRYSQVPLGPTDAHSYVIETFADFGLLGTAISFALLVAWCIAAYRTLRPPARDSTGGAAGNDADAERAGLLTLLAVVLTFGTHSLIDWTWFIPGTAVPALLCAGWLAGRGPIGQPIGRLGRRRHLLQPPGAGAAVLAIVTLAVLAAWVIWQPLRSQNADSSAITAWTQGELGTAITDERTAATADPVSYEPLWNLSAIYAGLGNQRAARQELSDAVSRQRSNPVTWEQLGLFDLEHGHPAAALRELRIALHLDVSSTEIPRRIDEARGELARRAARRARARRLAAARASAQRVARASSVRLSSGGPATVRTLTSANPNSSSNRRSEDLVYR